MRLFVKTMKRGMWILFIQLPFVLYGQNNAFHLDLDKYKNIDPDLITYRELPEIQLDLQNPAAMAAGPAGFYISGDFILERLDAEGTVQWSRELADNFTSLYVDENDRLFAASETNIFILNDTGEIQKEWTVKGNNTFLTSIAADEGMIYAADAGAKIIRKFDVEGKVLGIIGEKNPQLNIPGFVVPSPYFDVAIGHDGSIWAVNPGRHKMENYATDGRLFFSWGKASTRIEGFCGCCNPTHIAILPDGSFVTSEKGIIRVKVYDQQGKLTSVVASPVQFSEGTIISDIAVNANGQLYILDTAGKTIRRFVHK